MTSQQGEFRLPTPPGGSDIERRIETSEYKIKGRSYTVPMARVEGREVISVGGWLRVASLRDEEWLEGELVPDPMRFIGALRETGLRADILTFPGPIDGPMLAGYYSEPDNSAVIDTSDFKAWWDGLAQEARRYTRRAAKLGIEVRSVPFDLEFAKGIKSIYDEVPMRQGRKFWHYGKELEQVRRENSTYVERSEFLGAYYQGQLVGFIKMVYVDDIAHIMQILSLVAHQDKRPLVALIVKAAEICHGKGMRYLTYAKYVYGNKTDASITEFKRRLGFKRKDFPRYFVPLTLRGRIALRLGVHAGLVRLLPEPVIKLLLEARTWWLQRKAQRA